MSMIQLIAMVLQDAWTTVDPDLLASSEASWSGSTLQKRIY